MQRWVHVALVAIVVVCATGVGCGERGAPETTGQAAEEGARAQEREGGVHQKADALAHAAEEGAVARGVKAVEEGVREAGQEVKEHGAAGAAEEGAKVVEENVERSADTAAETYRAERKQSVGRVEAAGDAYQAVRELPEKKESEEKDSEKKDSEEKESE